MYKKPIKSHMCIEVLEHAGNNAVFRFYDNLDGVSESFYCSNGTQTPYFVAGEGKGAELIKQVKYNIFFFIIPLLFFKLFFYIFYIFNNITFFII